MKEQRVRPAAKAGLMQPPGAAALHMRPVQVLRWLPWLVLISLGAAGCQRDIEYPANYREYAYITNGGSNTVTVLDVVNMRQDRVLAVGATPMAIAASPTRNEAYAVSSGGGSVSVINAENNTVAATIGVGRQPHSIDVDGDGKRAYVANAGSNNVSVIDVAQRRVVAVIGAGESPSAARIAPDGKTLVITNRASGSVSIVDVPALRVRSTFDRCPGAADAIILPDSSKAFVPCTGGHQILVIGLAHAGGSYPLSRDVLLSFLDVGKSPLHIALKPDGGEAFVSNYDSDTISELTTSSNEVGGAYLVGAHPVHGLVSQDNSLLYVSDFSSGQITIYSIDDGKRIGSVKVGEGPNAMSFASSGRFLLVVNSLSGDIAVVRTNVSPASLLTFFPAGRDPNGIAVKAFLVH